MIENKEIIKFPSYKPLFKPRITIDPHKGSCTFYIGDYVTSITGTPKECCEQIVKRVCCYDEQEDKFVQQYSILLDYYGEGGHYYYCLTKKYGLEIEKIKARPIDQVLPIIIND